MDGDDRPTRAALEARLHTRALGRNLEIHDEIASTNTRAVALAREGAPEGTLVLAEVQTEGRGRLNRRWYAPKGTSLLMSLILRPALMPRQAQRVTMICSLSIVEAVNSAFRLDARPDWDAGERRGKEARVKWPNDIVVSGKKMGGLLTEMAAKGDLLDFIVVGIGLNVNLDVAALPELTAPATSVLAELGRPVSRAGLLAAILEGIESRAERLAQGWSPHEEWREHLATLGEWVQVSVPDGMIEGIAEDVDEDGALLVRMRDGRLRHILAGDVTLRRH